MNRKVSIAPMMDCTDRHERYFLRLISKNVLLYTEMIVSEAIDRGDKKKLLSFNIKEKPVSLQLGGSSPKLLANASKLGEEFGYDEINLNLGCPSKKIQVSKEDLAELENSPEEQSIESEPSEESMETKDEDVSLDNLKDEEIASEEQKDSETSNS